MPILTVKVIARASQCAVVPQADGSFKIKLTKPAIEGRANEQLIALLAEHFHLSKSHIHIVGGAHTSIKRVQIDSESGS